MTKEEMKERMENLKKQRDLLVQKKQQQLKKEWDNFDDKEGGDSRKDMINKGLGSLGIKEGEIKFKTEEQKELDKQRKLEEKKKAAEEAKKAKE